jgi:hypothetical protein
MPRFYEETEFDIDPCDFLDDCDTSEIQEIIEYLEENGYLKNHSTTDRANGGLLEEEFQERILKISVSRHRLTLEEEEIIKKISDRL